MVKRKRGEVWRNHYDKKIKMGGWKTKGKKMRMEDN